MKVRRAIITAAGWGTRFLPVTRSQPKEMLPIIDEPVIQYAVEEAVNSGIEHIVIITALGKQAIEDYFDRCFELEYFLKKKGETALLKKMRDISSLADICYIRQKEQLGLGHAILTARSVIGNEPFAVILPDDIIDSEVPALKQMMTVYNERGGNIIAVETVKTEDTVKYGIIKPEAVTSSLYRVLGLVEKPASAEAPSNLGVVGRYILMPEVFDIIGKTPSGKNQEIQLTDALEILLQKQAVYAWQFEGTRYDVGTPIGLLKATAAMALKRPDIREEFRDYLSKLL